VIILGIDPGLANTGWGVISRKRSGCTALAYGCITTAASEDLAQRLASIHREIIEVIERYGPDACAIETVWFGVNARSAFATGQARGVAVLATANAAVPIAEYPPAVIKSIVTGSGAADKDQVTYMVRTLLALDHDPRPDHAADALAIALTHATMCDRAALEGVGA
jgi:crossover junction endodeoxyribonuclease RuvC